MLTAAKFWDRAAKKYIARPIKDLPTYQKKLQLTAGYLAPTANVLEVGCGSGATAIYHAPQVQQILATDISPVMLQHGRDSARQAGIANIEFRLAAIEQLSADTARFDAVLALNVLHLVDDVAAALTRIYTLLAENGVFVSSTS